ncbi:MAG: glycosyltransferase family 2 protein [Nitrososphaeraceae archaeon]|nr:glycosyltransferase family 2 protein [Nitrososphaeraceae archaeon]
MLTWSYLLISTIQSLIRSPKLTNYTNYKNQIRSFQKVSIIVPARNEAKYIKKCIESLLKQSYPNFEIILVNDSSSDNTLNILKDYEKNNSNIITLDVKTRPYGWIGKNWACYNGYLKSSGDLLLFTDADSYHSISSLEMSVSFLNSNDLQALTIVPKLLSNDIFTKFTLPILTTFLYTQYSPLKVNNPNSKLGYFFGSYYIITKKTYEDVGTHRAVKNEIIEDGALGKKVKEGKYSMKMIRGESVVNAHWARNRHELIDAIDRLVIPLSKGNSIKTLMLTIALFFLILSPFLLITCFLCLSLLKFDKLLFMVSEICLLIITLIILTSTIQTKNTLGINWLHSLGAPIGGFIIVFGFIKGIIKAFNNGTVNWRGRRYVISSHQNPL